MGPDIFRWRGGLPSEWGGGQKVRYVPPTREPNFFGAIWLVFAGISRGDPKSLRNKISADCKRGRRKGATSKNVKNRQKVFRHFSIFAQGKRIQKSSKSVKKFFDTFRQFSCGTIFPAPLGGSEKVCVQCLAPISELQPTRICTARLEWVKRQHPQREGTNLGVFVPIWLVLPRREATNLGVFDLCHLDLLKRSCSIAAREAEQDGRNPP